MLTPDQRAVLLHLGDADILLDEPGWDNVMRSCRGGCGPRADGAPLHTIHRYDCGAGKVVAEWFDGAVTAITKAQLAAYRRDLAPALLQALRAARTAHDREYRSAADWCMCPKQRGETDKCSGLSWDRERRHHPTDDEYYAHIDRTHQLRAGLRAALEAALHLAPEPQAGVQLELFGVAS